MEMLSLIKRTGKFAEIDPRRCHHYAGFIEDIGRRESDLIFWCLFGTVLLLLIIASSMYTRNIDYRQKLDLESRLKHCRKFSKPRIWAKANITLAMHISLFIVAQGSAPSASKTLSAPELDLEKSPRRSLSISASTNHRRTRIYCLLVSLSCVLFAIPCIIMEAFAMFHIQFCDGEDLMMLYWGFWTLIQVGSMIAILGIALNQWYGLNNHSQPPWGVALGTPVLVIAALAHYVRVAFKKASSDRREARSERTSPNVSRANSVRGRTEGHKESVASKSGNVLEETMSRTSTMVSIAPPGSRFVGFSLEDEPLFAFPADPSLWSSSASSRRMSAIDPLFVPITNTNTAVNTPKKSRSPEREEKEVTFAEEVSHGN